MAGETWGSMAHQTSPILTATWVISFGREIITFSRGIVGMGCRDLGGSGNIKNEQKWSPELILTGQRLTSQRTQNTGKPSQHLFRRNFDTLQPRTVSVCPLAGRRLKSTRVQHASPAAMPTRLKMPISFLGTHPSG